ncbi:MAG: OB-fold domain-containing protein [Microthrixaceae bacterium]
MRGIISSAGYLPHWRLQRPAIAAVLGGSAGKGTRTVASFDEDATTLAVEASRRALRGAGADVTSVWFATTSPTYMEKTNATVLHAALRLPATAPAADAAGALRGTNAALRAALRSTETGVLVAAGDVRTGPAGSSDERDGGDAGAAVLVGDADATGLVAEFLGTGSATREFLDRWRVPGELRTRAWEERFGQQRYDDLAGRAFESALADAGLEAAQVARVAISAPHARAGAALAKRLGAAGVEVADALGATVGFTGAAHPLLLLARLLEDAAEGQVVALVALADGADVFLFRRTAAPLAVPTVGDQLDGGDDSLPYAKYLSWRGVLPVQPPNRPEPARMSASAAERRLDWKYGFVGSADRESGALHLPPSRVSFVGGNVDDMDPAPMADVPATVATFTVDSLAYSPSPPVVFAVCDFEGGGRLPMELTDTTAAEVSIGMPVEMTFRRLNAADGIANYFWKARPVRSGPVAGATAAATVEGGQ